GVGTLLAFPGGMIGAVLAGYAYRWFKRSWAAGVGEVFGTGILGALAGGLLVAPVLMDAPLTVAALIPSFLGSSALGVAIGLPALAVLRRAGLISNS
ncbi:MAG: energy coupling factor transporter S component ThiW, partial [Spirochaeta sp.]